MIEWLSEEPAPATRRAPVLVFVVGTVVTFGVALLLYGIGRPVAAGGVIVASPFPCPPGMPC